MLFIKSLSHQHFRKSPHFVENNPADIENLLCVCICICICICVFVPSHYLAAIVRTIRLALKTYFVSSFDHSQPLPFSPTISLSESTFQITDLNFRSTKTTYIKQVLVTAIGRSTRRAGQKQTEA